MTADHSKAMLLILGAITGSACLDPGACTTSVEPAIRVEVRDAATGAFIADIARGVARDGDFEDSLRVIGATGGNPSIGTTLGGADERPGTYAIHLGQGRRPVVHRPRLHDEPKENEACC